MDSTVREELALSQNNPRVALVLSQIAFSRGDYDAAERVADSIAKANPGDEFLRAQSLGIGSAVAMVRGQMAKSLRLTAATTSYNVAHGSPAAALSSTFDSAMVEAWFRGSNAKA